MIDAIVPYNIDENGNVRAFTRGVDMQDGHISEKYDSLSGYWVDTITNSFDQDISAMWVGAKGSGKSSAVLSVCHQSAIKVSAWVNDGSTWEDFYNLHELTACILEEDSTKLMNIQRKYVIKNFDDIGIGWGARNWRDEENQEKNDIFQINRTDNAIQCFSVPNQFLLDKVPRSLVSHYIEMDHQLFELGFTTIKVFKPKTLFREGKIFNPYLQVDRSKFVNYLIPAPPHDLWSEYKKLRARNKDIAIKARAESRKKSAEAKELEFNLKLEKLKDKEEREKKKAAETAAKLEAKKLRALKRGDVSAASEFQKEIDTLHVERGESKKVVANGKADATQRWTVQFEEYMIPGIPAMIRETGKSADKCMAIIAQNRKMDGMAIRYFRDNKFLQKYGIDDKPTKESDVVGI
jgi:hypothetical protein